MKKLFIVMVVCVVVSGRSVAQTYSTLWQRVESAQKADLPMDELSALSQIVDKAHKDKFYGQLLKAQLEEIAVKANVSPDSLAPMVERYEREADDAQDKALKAVYFATLGHIYKVCNTELGITDTKAKQMSKEYYDKALADPATLAKTKARTYDPLLEAGSNSSIFSNDLLHVVAMEAEDYQVMIDYYTRVGNRPATCMASLEKLRSERTENEEARKSKYLARIDSLIHEYYDLDVTGEVAIEHFNVMDSSPDVSAEEKIEFIDDALVRWQNWPRMVVLKNARSRITLPSYNVNIPETLVTPGRETPVYVTSLKNLQTITMNVYRVNISGNENYDPNTAEDYKMILTRRGDRPVASDSRTYYGLPEYREIRDTLMIEPLEVGIYLVEFHTDNSSVATERFLLHVSNLRVVDMNLPGDRMRLVAVDATTGQPVAGARIVLKFRGWQDKKLQEDETTLTTEGDGEVEYSSTVSPYKYRVTTAQDNAFPWQNISRRTWRTSSAQEKTTNMVKTFADRSIYRPNQRVGVSVVAYTTHGQEEWEVTPAKSVHIELRDTKNNVVGETDVTTDEWGVGATSFDLPEGAMTGYYSLRASTSDGAQGGCSLRVEEYKRPMFTVDVADYSARYKAGDTIRVEGVAQTFAGIPVAGAKIEYRVETQMCSWWRRDMHYATEVLWTDETQTRNDGRFTMDVPIEFPSDTKKGNRFARITLTAKVTDTAGETHTAVTSYPLSDKEVAFALSGFDAKQCREDAKPFVIAYLNNAGVKIDEKVSYTIDGGTAVVADANTEVTLPLENLSSGEHELKAMCVGDTLSQKFVVFSLDDTQVPVDTDAWYYSTTGGQKNYNMTPAVAEYVQIGTSRQEQVVYYAIASETELLESGQLTLNNQLMKRSFVYKEEWGNGVAVCYAWVRNGVLYSYSESMARPVKDCSLDVEWKTFRDRLTPGESEVWSVSVKNPDGTAAKAQLMAVLFDKSLDQLYPHDWSLVHRPYYAAPTIYETASYDVGKEDLYGEQSIRYMTEPSLTFYTFSFPSLPTPRSVGMLLTGMMRSRALNSADGVVEASMMMASGVEGASESDATTESDTAVRENLEETAFFMPQLVADKNGDVEIRFTLPESVTTWRFMGVAHDKTMNVGSLEGEVVAQKNLMVQPNMPRFVRVGDKAQLSATVANMSGETLSATATLRLTNMETEKMVFEMTRLCEVEAEGTTVVTFDLPQDLAADVYTCDVVVKAGNLSDGERHALPVLTDEVEVSTTRAFTQTKAGEKTIDLGALYGEGAKDESLKVEYTDNPAWLLLDALPVVATPESENAISLAVALFANSVTQGVADAMGEGVFSEKNVTNVDELESRLQKLQNSDGSFSWFDGMRPSMYVTHAVTRLLARMSHLGLQVDDGVLTSAIVYMDKEMAMYVERLKETEKKSGRKAVPTDLAMDYLYVQAVSGQTLSDVGRANAEYLLSCMTDCQAQLTIYGKANVAVVMATHPVSQNMGLARELLESVRQYSVYTEEMGRYFDTPKAQYSWQDYKIPTQTAAIEALQTIEPTDVETIAQMQQWLLQEKRTQEWDTPLNSAAAIYAFFDGKNGFEDGKLAKTLSTDDIAATRLYVDGREIEGDRRVEGCGLVSETLEGRHENFTTRKSSEGVSWGAVFVSYTQRVEDVTSDGEYLSVRREMVDMDGNVLVDEPMVGQRVRVRITVDAQRDLDFVKVVDERAACLEPADQLTGYKDGCFVRPGDNKTTYYFDSMAKGRHTLETDYYVDRAGTYLSGIATVRCTYAPEYQAREGMYRMDTTK